MVFLSLQAERLNRLLIYLVSFAAGAFFGDVFFHLLPELVEENGFSIALSLQILAGIVFFLVIEKVVQWRHCHSVDCDRHSLPLTTMNLIGDGVHNFIDGIVIGVSFIISIPVGIATTIAVIVHEIPQEIGDCGVLLYGGLSKKKTLLFNFLSATLAIAGTIIALFIGVYAQTLTTYLGAFGVGTFLYIAGSDLIPEIKRDESLFHSLIQSLIFMLGIGMMALLLVVE